MELFLAIVVAVEKWKGLSLSKQSVFSTAPSRCGHLQPLVLVIFATGQHCPGHAS
jgi:hypothetical protein